MSRDSMHLYYQVMDRKVYLKNFFRSNQDKFCQSFAQHLGADEMYMTSSGRSAILLSLISSGIGRNDEIFIPPFMSSCVLSSICEGGMPTLHFSENTKVVLLYHQWGFPQDFSKIIPLLKDKNVFVIEDCAHGFWGETGGVKIGSFGDTASYSLSKIFECTYSGTLRVNNKDFSEKVKSQLSGKGSIREKIESLIGEYIYIKYYNTPFEKRSDKQLNLDLTKWYNSLLTYPKLSSIRGRLPRSVSEVDEVFSYQHDNFIYLLDEFKMDNLILPEDNMDSLAPLCFPLLSDDEEYLKSVNNFLMSKGIHTGIYNFDINRNMFSPKYKRCALVPLHESIDRSVLRKLVKKFKG